MSVLVGTLMAPGMDMQALGAQTASPRSASTRRYVWLGQVKSNRFKPGDHIIMDWGSPKTDETDAIIYVEEHVVGGINHSNEFGYVPPGDLVSSDAASKTLTLKTFLDPKTFDRFASIRPDQWVKVTSPLDQSKPTLRITDVQPTAVPSDSVRPR